MDLDSIDIALLAALQQDARLSTADLSDRLHLSASQIGRRRARLEAEGYVRHYAARLDPNRLGLTIQAFVEVSLASHAPAKARTLLNMLQQEPRVISVWTLTGEADYLLRVYCEDLGALNTLIHARLLPHETVARVRSQIVMDQPKADAGLPL